MPSKSTYRCPYDQALARQFAQSNIQQLDSNDKFEEETLPWYTQDRFYPVKIGEILGIK
ncbi:unnamed protein product [Penicillium camemberti]|uniref:Str. FM013 n=1 Tax=Penicillium camemberti (strain FM 013) TaxID=1429867 RepID=A0A0G4PVD3_PENC3|nr:unnamed protein product [Penicillium camemberti]